MAKDILTTLEAAQYISDSILPESMPRRTTRSVTRLCKQGKIEGAYRVFGDWCVPRKGLDQYMQSQQKFVKNTGK